MSLNEKELMPLFQQQEKLDPRSEEYLSNREVLMRKILKQLHSSLSAKQYEWTHKYRIDSGEAESLIYESLLSAIDAYKPSRGNCKFSSFFWTITSQIFKNHLSKIYAQKRTPRLPTRSLNQLDPDMSTFAPMYSLEATSDEDDQWLSLHDLLPSKDISNEQAAHNKFLVERIREQLTDREKLIIDRLYAGDSYSEVGKLAKLAPSDICNVVKKIRERFKEFKGDVNGKEVDTRRSR